ncbi:hypothetical protein L484_002828 [Morus notabilis]|uniref:Uncharacterized protein n=1 Tax=Morus notabilis TaxID=981085 RepID=W9S688_9ROSA|nr:hypothetical protein L484_002828 [Morus notabilis]
MRQQPHFPGCVPTPRVSPSSRAPPLFRKPLCATSPCVALFQSCGAVLTSPTGSFFLFADVKARREINS